jgi:prepilin peptidase CpaA
MNASFLIGLWFAALAALFAAAITDMKERRIPNKLVLVVLVLGVVLRLRSYDGTLWLSLLVTALVFAAGAWLASLEVIGGGDAKMIAAVTLLVPPAVVPILLVCIALAGGLLSGFYLGADWLVRRNGGAQLAPGEPHPNGGNFDHLVRIEAARMLANDPMPYGVAIFGGVASLILIGVFSCISATSCSL